MSKLEQAIKNYDSAIDEYYADGFYPSVEEERILENLENIILIEARNSIIELQALEIIKKKNVDVASFKPIVSTHPKKALEYYNQSMGFNPRRILKQDEFDLLKEVLCDE